MTKKILTDKEIIKIGKHAGAIPHAADSYTLHGYITFARAIEEELLDVLNEDRVSKYTLWSNEEEEQMLQLLRDGYKVSMIADILGRTESSTRGRYNLLKANGRINFPTPGVRTKITPKDIDEIIRLRKEGLSYKAIANKVSRSHHAVKWVCADNGAAKTGITTLNWTPDEDKKLKQLVSDGASYREISAAIGRSVYAIRQRQKSLGIKHHTNKPGSPSPKVRKQRSEVKIKSKPSYSYKPVFKPTGNPWLDIAG